MHRWAIFPPCFCCAMRRFLATDLAQTIFKRSKLNQSIWFASILTGAATAIGSAVCFCYSIVCETASASSETRPKRTAGLAVFCIAWAITSRYRHSIEPHGFDWNQWNRLCARILWFTTTFNTVTRRFHLLHWNNGWWIEQSQIAIVVASCWRINRANCHCNRNHHCNDNSCNSKLQQYNDQIDTLDNEC